jgi:hypothetical protein
LATDEAEPFIMEADNASAKSASLSDILQYLIWTVELSGSILTS